jgi:hypothetical protein
VEEPEQLTRPVRVSVFLTPMKKRPRITPRGVGPVEGRIIELLEGADSLEAEKIAWWIAGQAKPTAALAASVRRAVSGLQKKGRVVAVEGRAWMLEEKWRRREDQRKRDEAAERERVERERIAQADARQKADAERRARKDVRRALAVERAPHRGTDIAADAARLVKVLSLFASAHDGEVLSAARQAEQIRRRLGRRWDELIIVHNLYGKAAIPPDTGTEPYVHRNQDEVDSAIDAFQQAMSESSLGRNRR